MLDEGLVRSRKRLPGLGVRHHRAHRGGHRRVRAVRGSGYRNPGYPRVLRRAAEPRGPHRVALSPRANSGARGRVRSRIAPSCWRRAGASSGTGFAAISSSAGVSPLADQLRRSLSGDPRPRLSAARLHQGVRLRLLGGERPREVPPGGERGRGDGGAGRALRATPKRPATQPARSRVCSGPDRAEHRPRAGTL